MHSHLCVVGLFLATNKIPYIVQYIIYLSIYNSNGSMIVSNVDGPCSQPCMCTCAGKMRLHVIHWEAQEECIVHNIENTYIDIGTCCG